MSSKELLYEQLQRKLDRQKLESSPEYQKMLAQDRAAERSGVDAYAPLVSAASQAAASMGGSQSNMPKIGMRLAELSRQKPMEQVSRDSGIDLNLLKGLSQMEQQDKQFSENKDLQNRQLAQRQSEAKQAQGRYYSGLDLQKKKLAAAEKMSAAKMEALAKRSDKPVFKQNQYIAAGFGKRAEAANKIATELEGSGYDPATTKKAVLEGLPDIIGNQLMSDQDQQYNQSRRDFVSAVLRRESGAAISESEYANEGKKYFPQPGDSAAVIAQKAVARERAISSLETEAGGAWDQMDEIAFDPFDFDEGQEDGTAYAGEGDGLVAVEYEGEVFRIPKNRVRHFIQKGAELVEE